MNRDPKAKLLFGGNRLGRPLALLNMVGAFAIGASTSSSARFAPSMPEVGYDTNRVWVVEEEVAMTEAKIAADSGANTIRILVPFSVGSGDVLHDLGRYCNALIATQHFGMNLKIGIDWYKNGKIGNFPDGASELNAARTMGYNLMSRLANGCKDSEGNIVKAKEVDLALNEPNYKQRYKEPHMGLNVANALAYLTPRFRADAAKLGIVFKMGLDLATSETNQPVTFTNEVANPLDQIDPKHNQTFIDEVGLNYYASGQFTTDNLRTKNRVVKIGRMIQSLRGRFGKDIQIGISEAGAISDTPPDKEVLYNKSVPPTAQIFPGRKQGEFYRKVSRTAACLGLKEFLIFHKTDDEGDQLRTGDTNPDGSPKASEPMDEQTFAEAKAGTIPC